MKVLVIIVSHEMNSRWEDNIKILNNYLHNLENITVEYCGISSNDDFHNFEHIIKFRYKVINSKLQLSKICDFISENKENLNYDWFIKTRPDLKLLEPIDFKNFSDDAINGRARVYKGPKRVKWGMSINGIGIWHTLADCAYEENENEVILDDVIYIFSNKVVKQGAFEKVEDTNKQHEWVQTAIWKNRNIKLNVVGLNVLNEKYDCYSGDVNL